MSRSKEKAAEIAIDRSMFQEYNYLLKRLENVSFCYMFIGKSFEGMKKLEQFSKLVYDSSQIWSQLTSNSVEESAFENTTRIQLNQYVDSVFSG